MTSICTINPIHTYISSKNKVVCYDKDNSSMYLFDVLNQSIQPTIIASNSIYYTVYNQLLIADTGISLLLYDIENSQIKVEYRNYGGYFLQNFIDKRCNDGKYYYSGVAKFENGNFEINLETCEVKEISKVFNFRGRWFIQNNQYYRFDEQLLYFQDFVSEELLWKFSIEGETYNGVWNEEENTIHDVCIVGEHVLVATTLYHLALNKNTGQEIWRSPTWVNKFAPKQDEGIFYCLSGTAILCVRFENGEILKSFETKKFREKYGSYTYGIAGELNIVDNYLIFTLQDTRRIVVMDRYSFEIVHDHHLEGAMNTIPSTEGVQIQGNRLYQLDGDNTLHILEWKELAN